MVLYDIDLMDFNDNAGLIDLDQYTSSTRYANFIIGCTESISKLIIAL